MTHTTKDFSHLINQIPGLSEKQLRAHFGLYESYVKKINEIEEKLQKADRKSANYSYGEYSELERRRAVPYNGAYLHELYFENLTGIKTTPSPELKMAIEQAFCSLENWKNDVRAGLLSAHGWVLLVRSRRNGALQNNVIEEHHRGVFIEQDIILALDGWEHAYAIDYGTAKSEYIQTLEKSIDWGIVNRRFLHSRQNGQIAA